MPKLFLVKGVCWYDTTFLALGYAPSSGGYNYPVIKVLPASSREDAITKAFNFYTKKLKNNRRENPVCKESWVAEKITVRGYKIVLERTIEKEKK